MTNGHTLEWNVELDCFYCIAKWKSIYELYRFHPLGIFLYKHVLRNPQSALQPNLCRNFQNKTLLELGSCSIGPYTRGFLGSEINPKSDNLEQLQDEQNTKWIQQNEKMDIQFYNDRFLKVQITCLNSFQIIILLFLHVHQ